MVGVQWYAAEVLCTGSGLLQTEGDISFLSSIHWSLFFPNNIFIDYLEISHDEPQAPSLPSPPRFASRSLWPPLSLKRKQTNKNNSKHPSSICVVYILYAHGQTRSGTRSFFSSTPNRAISCEEPHFSILFYFILFCFILLFGFSRQGFSV